MADALNFTIQNEVKADSAGKSSASKRHLIFFLALFTLISCATVRSSIATRFDSFTIDEAYHIGAGAAYVQTGDFRLNPEHPPLVKLWVGAFVSGIYQLSAYRTFLDKGKERTFVEDDVYLKNDPDNIQRRSRTAMFVLNGLLLVLFALATRRLFGDIMALAVIACLAIDPTIAANLPLVMTDLPVALLSATAVLLAVSAFRSWRAVDLIPAALVLGLALSAKHSAVVAAALIAFIGIIAAISLTGGAGVTVRLRRFGLVVAVLIGAVIVLWSFYLFRFRESPTAATEQFNRPLAEKVNDVNSPYYRAGLRFMERGHLFPRAYTWGMADTIRAGAEGRTYSVFAFGRKYEQAPFYLVPGLISVKLPIGLLMLAALGAGVLVMRRAPREFVAPLLGLLGLSILFWIVLARGSTYGGIRHALPIVPFIAMLASLAIYQAVKSRSQIMRYGVGVGLAVSLLSAIPVIRPWEYYNEIVGGAANGYLYFGDEGVDIGMRARELVKYYDENLKASGEIPFIVYPIRRAEMERRGVDWVRNDRQRDADRLNFETVNGTFLMTARQVRGRPAFREATPIARLGNLFVFRGTFYDPKIKITSLTRRAKQKIYSSEPDIEGAIKLLTEALALDPKRVASALELGNQYVKIGNREEALRAYQLAKANAPASGEISKLLASQVELVATRPLHQISPLRNPEIE